MKRSKTVLFLPFLQIPSGHHQAANALIDGIQSIHSHIRCEKVDILSYSYGRVEFFISKIYLKWIRIFPSFYNLIYQTSVYKNIEHNKRFWVYEMLFIPFIKKLIKEKQPDLIVCTHSLPAYMLNYLKGKSEVSIPVINVYTDYFIHRFWGIEHIDYHFVPSLQMKKFLNEKGISDERIIITGIPIHSKIKKQREKTGSRTPSMPSVLISAGNLGVGGIEKLILNIAEGKSDHRIQYYVLCGKNINLYEKLAGMQKNHIVPFPYISCREKMNELYEKADAILTKPGGVTVSESIFKRKPIFIYDALPGQEEINLKKLKDLGLVFPLDKQDIPGQLYSILQNFDERDTYQNQVAKYHSFINDKEPSEIIAEIIK